MKSFTVVTFFLLCVVHCLKIADGFQLVRPARNNYLLAPKNNGNGRYATCGYLPAPTPLRAVLLNRTGNHATSSKPSLLGWIKTLSRAFAKYVRRTRGRVMAIGLALLLSFASSINVAEAVPGARAGGSFGPSRSRSAPIAPRSSMGRSMPRSRPPIIINRGPSWGNPHYHYHSPISRGNAAASLAVPRRNRSVSEIAFVATVGLIIINGVVNERSRRGENELAGPLGPGATSTSLTVAVNVPDRNDPSNILQTLENLSIRSDTTTRKGVQNLVSNAALELLRQEQNIVSAFAESEHFSNSALADRAFQRSSIVSRSKFEFETINKFGSSEEVVESSRKETDFATKAVVTLNLSIEGDSTVVPKFLNRQTLLKSLSKIASDAQVEDCLLGGEVLWAPTAGGVLYDDDLITDYPNLISL